MSSEMTGTVFDIKKFAIHDGPGIRTTVFLKGCPLKCLWCHNPESQRREQEISFMPEKCIGCGWCFENCPSGAHVMQDDAHILLRDKCISCGKCAEQCYAQAIEVIGKEMSTAEAIEEVLKDKPFYDNSGGGMTISGGEPMMQFEFTKALLQEAKNNGLHTCLDTCGFAPFERYRELLDNVDIVLYDFKESDPVKHEEFTGVPLQPILDNLHRIDDFGCNIMLRCPLIPGLNDREEHLLKIAETANSLSNVSEITLHPYHPLGKSKSERIGSEYTLGDLNFAEEEAVANWLDIIQSHTKVKVTKG